MSGGGDLVVGVLANVLHDVLREAIGALRRLQRSWERPFLASLKSQGVALGRRERRQLLRWLHTWDLDALVGAKEGGSGCSALVRALSDEVFGTADPHLVATASDPPAWAASNTAKAERLAGALWGALVATLDRDELRAVRTAVAVRHTEQLVESVMAELGWLRDELDDLPRMVEPERLPLERAWLRLLPGIASTPYHLLWARSGVVPYDDRAGWLRDLTHWCEADDRLSLRIVVGTGGMGKTRLALELCRRMAQRGWLTGIYQPRGDGALTALASEPLPRLVVIDYADVQPEMVREIVMRLLDRLPQRAHRVRVLLLVRRLGRKGDPRRWFTGPQDRTTQVIDAAQVLSVSEQVTTPGGRHTERVAFGVKDRRRLFASAASEFARHMPGSPAAKPPDLSEPTYGSPLFVLVVALLSVTSDSGTAPAGAQPDTLLDLLLEREQRQHWRDCPVREPAAQECAVGLATLVGADDEAEALRHVSAQPRWSNDMATTLELVHWLHGLYEGNRWLNPLEPDVFGEYLVHRVLDQELLRYAVTLPVSESASQAFALLSRLVATRATWRKPVQNMLRDLYPNVFVPAIDAARAAPFDVVTQQFAAALTTLIHQIDLGDVATSVRWEKPLGPSGHRLAEALTAQAVAAARRAIPPRDGSDGRDEAP